MTTLPSKMLVSAFGLALAALAEDASATALSKSSSNPIGGTYACDNSRNQPDCRFVDMTRSEGRSTSSSNMGPLTHSPSAVDLWFSGDGEVEHAILENWNGDRRVADGGQTDDPVDHWMRTLTFGLPYAYSDSEIFDPAAVTLLGVGLLGFVAVRRRKSA